MFVENYLIPYISHMEESLAYASGKSILAFQKDIEIYRVDWVVHVIIVRVYIQI